jgi:hypothetical protein
MKRYQTKSNNCFSTCIANILFLNDEELNAMYPHDEEGWFKYYQEQLKKYGYQILCVKTGRIDRLPDTLCIISGKSPYTKGIDHSVIGNRNKILFDPKPENKGLLGYWKDWEFCYLIPVNNYKKLVEDCRGIYGTTGKG